MDSIGSDRSSKRQECVCLFFLHFSGSITQSIFIKPSPKFFAWFWEPMHLGHGMNHTFLCSQAREGIELGVLQSYCWMYSSLRIPREFRGACSSGEAGADTRSDIVYNTFYQWVPLYLIFMAFLSDTKYLWGFTLIGWGECVCRDFHFHFTTDYFHWDENYLVTETCVWGCHHRATAFMRLDWIGLVCIRKTNLVSKSLFT